MQSRVLQVDRRVAIATAAVWFTSALFFRAIYHIPIPSDLQPHMAMTQAALTGQANWPGNPLYYFMQALLAGWSSATPALERASVVILATAIAAKFVLSFQFIRMRGGAGVVAAGALALALLVAFSLQTPTRYLGQITPTVWHNSTTIFLVPFALAMFFAGCEHIESRTRRSLWIIIVAGLIGVAIKPTFTLIFPFAFGMCMVLRHRLAGLRTAVLVGVVLLGGVAIEYAVIYGLNLDSSGSSVVVSPFTTWHLFSADIPRSFAASVCFPVVALLVLRVRAFSDTGVLLGGFLAAAGVAVFAIFAETGPRATDGNFAWQAYVAMYMLFLGMTAACIRHFGSLRWFERGALAVGLGVHVAAGIRYLDQALSLHAFI